WGESRRRLREAHLCRVRHCPVCLWWRSLLWQAGFFLSLPRFVAVYPDARCMFLTLTVRNCAIGYLGETINRLNMAFQRLKDRKEFRPVQG
ncbi:protein rep, partial [Enterobacter hormaechei]|uniref:protein rep n=1 Tax=Enterobacter hormaechei TaxID=158836 RepID=UPI002874FF0E